MRPQAEAKGVAVRADVRARRCAGARQPREAPARAVQPDPERDPPHAGRRQRDRARRGGRRRGSRSRWPTPATGSRAERSRRASSSAFYRGGAEAARTARRRRPRPGDLARDRRGARRADLAGRLAERHARALLAAAQLIGAFDLAPSVLPGWTRRRSSCTGGCSSTPRGASTTAVCAAPRASRRRCRCGAGSRPPTRPTCPRSSRVVAAGARRRLRARPPCSRALRGRRGRAATRRRPLAGRGRGSPAGAAGTAIPGARVRAACRAPAAGGRALLLDGNIGIGGAPGALLRRVARAARARRRGDRRGRPARRRRRPRSRVRIEARRRGQRRGSPGRASAPTASPAVARGRAAVHRCVARRTRFVRSAARRRASPPGAVPPGLLALARCAARG